MVSSDTWTCYLTIIRKCKVKRLSGRTLSKAALCFFFNSIRAPCAVLVVSFSPRVLIQKSRALLARTPLRKRDGDHGRAREDGAAPCRVHSPALLRAASNGVPLLRRRFHDAPRPARAGAEHGVGGEREGGQGSRCPAPHRLLLGWFPLHTCVWLCTCINSRGSLKWWRVDFDFAGFLFAHVFED